MLDFAKECWEIAQQFPRKSPPIPVGHPLIGKIGLCVPGRGFEVQGMTSRAFNALMKDETRARNHIQRLKLLKEAGVLTNWDGVLTARAGGYADDRLYRKDSLTTVANAWSTFYHSTGYPGAGTYANIPTGAVKTNDQTSGFPMTDPGANTKYLLNFGVQHLTGTNIVMLVDLLVAAGNILLTSTSPQTVSSAALTRYTDGVGVMMIFEVTTPSSATACNITVAYDGTGGTGHTTGAVAFQTTTAVIQYRLGPVLPGTGIIAMNLQSGDVGVKVVNTFTCSVALGAGVVALNLYKPLVLIPTLAVTTFVERSTPGMLSGITALAKDSGNVLGCLTPFVLTSTTSTGVQTYWLQSCAG